MKDAVTAGHLGARRTFDKFNRYNYYWPHLRRNVQNYIASCDVCEVRKIPQSFANAQKRTASYNPQSNEMIERLNRPLKDILSKCSSVN